jgi:alpha-maltose-1-phosphate synthase
VVVDGVTGYLVPFEQNPVTTFPSNPDKFSRDLAEKISDLLADPEKAKRFGEAGRKRVEETFAWPAIAEQTIDLYRTLLRDRSEATSSQLMTAS